MKFAVHVTQRHHQRAAIPAHVAENLYSLRSKVSVFLNRRCSPENPRGNFPRFRVPLGFGLLTFRLCALPVFADCPPFGVSQTLAPFLTPCFFEAPFPASERTGGGRARVEHEPRIAI